MLQATVQGSFLFGGKHRRAGEIIPPSELAGVSQSTIDALVTQKLMVLSEEGSEPAKSTAEEIATLKEDVAELKALLQQVIDALPASKKKSA